MLSDADLKQLSERSAGQGPAIAEKQIPMRSVERKPWIDACLEATKHAPADRIAADLLFGARRAVGAKQVAIQKDQMDHVLDILERAKQTRPAVKPKEPIKPDPKS